MNNLAHGGYLEAGVDNIDAYRENTAAYCSDQGGGERGAKANMFEKTDDLADLLNELRSGNLHPGSADVHLVQFLFNTMQQRDVPHVWYNAFEESVTAVPEWALLEPNLAATAKMCGEKGSRDVMLSDEGVPRSPPMGRLARFRLAKYQAGSHIDFRWEKLEDVTTNLCPLYPFLVMFFKLSWLPREPDLAKRVHACLHTPWVGPYLELCLLLASGSGKWVTWLESCYRCYKDRKGEGTTWRARRRAQAEAENRPAGSGGRRRAAPRSGRAGVEWRRRALRARAATPPLRTTRTRRLRAKTPWRRRSC